MTKRTASFPLRLPESVKSEVERIAKEDGISMNQFIATAVAEKISSMRTAAYFLERASGGGLDLARRILNRDGGEPPAPEDELPV